MLDMNINTSTEMAPNANTNKLKLKEKEKKHKMNNKKKLSTGWCPQPVLSCTARRPHVASSLVPVDVTNRC